MTLSVFVFRNAILESTGLPVFDDHDADTFKTQFQRSLIASKPEQVMKYENTSLYYLGQYDDEKLQFILEPDPVLLLDCNFVLEKRRVLYELLAKARKEKEASEGDKDGKGK